MQVRVAPECASKGHKSARMDDDLAKAELALKNLEAVYSNTPDPYGQLLRLRQDLRLILSPPYQKLPSELWVKIFFDFTPVKFPLKADESLPLVSQVCRAWKDLIAECPQLSASISIVFEGEEPDVARTTQIAEQWLARADDTYPLEITVACVGPYAKIAHGSPDLVTDVITKIVLPRTTRLRQLDLTLPFQCLRLLFDLPAGSFPSLETLALHPSTTLADMVPPETGYSHWHWPTESTAFEGAHRLLEASYITDMLYTWDEIEGVHPNVVNDWPTSPDAISIHVDPVSGGTTKHGFFAPRFYLPWGRIQVLDFLTSALTPTEWHSIINQSPELKVLGIGIQPCSDRIPELVLTLEHLGSLHVAAYCGGGDAVLDCLVTPKLEYLLCTGPRFPLTSILSLQARSNFVLESLGLICIIEPDDLEPFLENFSSLKTIIFFMSEQFPASVWERICKCELLPGLTNLVLRPTVAQIPIAVDVIESRWSNAEFRVFFCLTLDTQAIKDELKRLDKFDQAEVERRVQVC